MRDKEHSGASEASHSLWGNELSGRKGGEESQAWRVPAGWKVFNGSIAVRVGMEIDLSGDVRSLKNLHIWETEGDFNMQQEAW